MRASRLQGLVQPSTILFRTWLDEWRRQGWNALYNTLYAGPWLVSKLALRAGIALTPTLSPSPSPRNPKCSCKTPPSLCFHAQVRAVDAGPLRGIGP